MGQVADDRREVRTEFHAEAVRIAVLYAVSVQMCIRDRVKGEYRFDFSELKRWIDLCKKCGIEYYEMSHLFSQWGARCV